MPILTDCCWFVVRLRAKRRTSKY